MPKKQKRQQRDLKPRLHIFCEGEKTEPNYLNGYIERCFPGTKLTLVRATKKNTPIPLVEEAIAEKSRRDIPEEDQFWVVYDRESSINYPDALHAEARDKAKANGIKIAFSNVCFEVWLLLHFQETVPNCDSCADLCKRSLLKKHIPDYDKGVKRNYTAAEVSMARKNAVKLNKQTKAGADASWTKPYQWNPYTNVHELLDEMDAHEKRYS
ncbi:MAG: RloB family protein [Kiritimatiellales bacterium]|jgi:hypothetical protein